MASQKEVAERREEVGRLWPDHTDAEIADRLGVPKWTVWNDVRALGLKKGQVRSERWRKARRGPGNPNWRGGSTRYQRNTNVYKKFVAFILARDEACLRCGAKHRLVVHHKESEADAPERLMDSNNCETLCRACHVKEHMARGDIEPINQNP